MTTRTPRAERTRGTAIHESRRPFRACLLAGTVLSTLLALVVDPFLL